MEFESCRNHKTCPAVKKGFWCLKHNMPMLRCDWCRTCPQCGGYMAMDRNGVEEEEYMVCLQCGVRYTPDGQRQEIPKRKEPTKTSNTCQVKGCGKSAHEGYKIERKGEKYRVCATHRDRCAVFRWRKLNPDRDPLIVVNGELVDNPKYYLYAGGGDGR